METETTFGIDIKEPERVLKEYTVKEVFNALKKNGFEHLRGSWELWDENGMKPVGACILGQGALNLDAFAAPDSGTQTRMGSDNPYTLYAQLNRFEYTGDKWKVPGKKQIGVLIVYWNDAKKKDSKGYELWGQYELETYKDVIKMAKDLLEPYFKEKVQLEVRDMTTKYGNKGKLI